MLPMRLTRRRVATATTLLVMVVVAMLCRRQLNADGWFGLGDKPKAEFETLQADNEPAVAAQSIHEGAYNPDRIASAGPLLAQLSAAAFAAGEFSDHDHDGAGHSANESSEHAAVVNGGGFGGLRVGFSGGHGAGIGFLGAAGGVSFGNSLKKSSPGSSSGPKATTPRPSVGGGGSSGSPATTPGTVVGGTQTTPIAVLLGSGTPPVDPGGLGGLLGGGSTGNRSISANGLSTTPEPASAFLIGTGLLGLAAMLRRRRS